MKFRHAVFALLLPFQASTAQEAAAARIELRPTFTARESVVFLGDVADIHSHDLQTIRRLVALPLGDRPLAGAQTIVPRDSIERWARLRLGLPRVDISWGGAPEVAVRTPATAMPTASRSPKGAVTVARGEWVSLRYRNGGVELESRAEVLQDGSTGDVVRVRASFANAPLQARVIAAGQVEAAL